MSDKKDRAKKERGNSKQQCSAQLVQDTQQDNTVAPLFSNTIFLKAELPDQCTALPEASGES